MRSESEVREQYEFLIEQLEDEEMTHRGVEELFTHYLDSARESRPSRE